MRRCQSPPYPFQCVRESFSARVPRSSLAGVHKEFVHHIVENEVWMIREKMYSKERKVEKSKRVRTTHKLMEMAHDT